MNPIAQVYRKEMREMLRDKRVRSSAFFGPMFLIVMLVVLLGSVISSLGKPESQRVHVFHATNPLVAALKTKKMTVVQVFSLEEGRKLVAQGKARVLLDFPASFVPGQQSVINAYVDPKQQLGQIALGAVSNVFDEVNRKNLKTILKAHNIPVTAAESVRIERNEVKVGGQGASDFIVGMLPYLIVIWAFYGGFSIVSDLVAGEKEKNTLETLLITPVNRTYIVLGKFLSLATICLLSSLSSLLGIMLVGVLNLPGTAALFKNGTGVTLTSSAVIIAVLIPAVAFFASILLAVSTYAKNPREAQTHLTLISFIVIMPAVFSQFIGLTDAGDAMWVNFVPVLNTANNIRLALLGKADLASIGITIVISAVLAAIALRWAIWLFSREQVLTRV